MKDYTTKRECYKKEIENNVLIPCELFDDATTGTRYTTKIIKDNKQAIDSKKRHEEERCIKPDQAGSFEEQRNTHQDLGTRYKPDQEGCPGVGQGLVVHLTDEGVEVQKFTEAGVQKKHYEQGRDTL